jgi:hypothetical protein
MSLMSRLLLVAALLPFSASAAISYIAESSDDNNSSSGQTVAEPTGTQQDDLVVCNMSMTAQDGDWAKPTDHTWIDASILTSVGGAQELAASYKIRGATAGDALSFAYSGTAAANRVSCYTVRGIDTTTPFDVTFVEGSHYAQANNDPTGACAAVTTVTDGAWVMLLQTITLGNVTVAAAPTNYTLRFSEVGTTNRQAATATREITSAGTETPGTWGHTGGGGTDDARCLTLAIRPAAAAGGGSVFKGPFGGPF